MSLCVSDLVGHAEALRFQCSTFQAGTGTKKCVKSNLTRGNDESVQLVCHRMGEPVLAN